MEKWDILDSRGVPLGRTFCDGEKLREGEYSLMVQIHLYTPERNFLMQKRSAKKKYYPGQWDLTGGRVQAGESSRNAIAREVKEELGLSLIPEGPKLLARFCLPQYHVLQDIYAQECSIRLEDCILQEEEVEQVRFVEPEEYFFLLKMNKSEEYLSMLRAWWKENS